MSTDSLVLSASRESLFVWQLTSRLSEIFELLPRLSTASGCRPLYRNFDQMRRITRLFGFHDLKPSFNCFLDIRKSFLISFSLRKTAWKGGHFGHIVAGLIFFNCYVQFHTISLRIEVGFLFLYYHKRMPRGAISKGMKADRRRYYGGEEWDISGK
jgi:hypothetical protein